MDSEVCSTGTDHKGIDFIRYKVALSESFPPTSVCKEREAGNTHHLHNHHRLHHFVRNYSSDAYAYNNMTERNHSPLTRTNSDPEKPTKPLLRHQKSWPTTNEPVSPRGPMKSTLMKLKDDILPENANNIPEEEEEGIPEPSKQSEIIKGIDSECTCTYAVSRVWYRKWEEYAGIPKGSTAGESEPPGPVDMDSHNDTNNEYIHEDVWRRFLKWFGISPTHQLDRKHLYFKDEKVFDVCVLSPFSGIVEHNVKKFNRFEEIGYIECQMRRVFGISHYKKTRLWISEKAQIPRFRQLLLRFRMLNDCIHRDKMYILALEECQGYDSWPTGEPGEAKGELDKYKDLVQGPIPDDHWSTEISENLQKLSLNVSESVKQMAEVFLQNSKSLLEEKENILDTMHKTLEAKLEETTSKENFLDDKSRQVAKQEEILKLEHDTVGKEREALAAKETQFQDELKQMESMHKIQETRIKLDIGGSTYTTSIQTLCRDPDSMLAAMFSGRHELRQESDGSYFIDRDGTHFRYILNFLRDGQLDPGTMPSDQVFLKELLREARYYQLSQLVQYVEKQLEINSNMVVPL